MKFEDVVNKTILKYYPVIFGSLFMIEWFITEFNSTWQGVPFRKVGEELPHVHPI